MSQGAKALGSRFRRTPQGVAPFAPNDPHSGYYNDLTTEALRHGSAAGAGEALRRMTADRRVANPITIAQLGLGSLQLRDSDSRWLEVARHAAVWVADNLDEMGLLAFHFSMPHTFRLVAPWSSSMAQGEAVSLLVRAGGLFHDRDYDACGARAMRSLLDPAGGLVTATPEGSVLQEYPTSPPAHVLNGWIFSLWGLYDYSLAGNDHALAAQAGTAFNAGSRTLNERLLL